MMHKNDLYKELYSLAKGSTINEFLLVRRNHFTNLLSKYNVEQSAVDECILKITDSNVYISSEKLLEKLPQETSYIILGEAKKRVLKRLPAFIKGVVDGIPLRLIDDAPFWSTDEISINQNLVAAEDIKALDKSLGQIYWLIYKELIEYEGFELLETMGSLASKELTINKIGTEATTAVENLRQYAKFNRIKALMKVNKNESNVLLELLNLNIKCKE